MSKRAKARRLTREDAEQLLRVGGWVLDEDITSRFNEAWQMPNAKIGRVYRHSQREDILFQWGEDFDYGQYLGSGFLFRTLADIELQIEQDRRNYAKYGPPVFGVLRGWHMLYKSIPQGQEFPAHVPALLEQLPALLSIPSEQLNGTLESMKLINKAIRRIGVPECSDPPIFPALVAYVGEYVRREIGGEWFVRLVDNQGTWEPLIRFANGTAIAVGMEVMDGIASDEGYPPDVMGNGILLQIKNPGGRVRLT